MSDINSLAQRVDAEFEAVAEKQVRFQEEQAEAHRQRQQRLEQLGRVFEQLRAVWGPRLELLVGKFAGHVKTTPRFIPSTREATFEFDSRLARVRLKFAAFTDRDVQKLTLSYDLEIIPVLMRFTPHAEIEFPLDAVDPTAVARWIDDRIVDFVRTFFALGENEVYLKDHMVEDPVSHVRFPRVAAAERLDWRGTPYYFVSAETRRAFEQEHALAAP
ncbi:MAG: hypothetical protein JNM56_06625 [Planctomycetia bacterium]|nr:hypothetical protein [Planctomycetia bacterium]